MDDSKATRKIDDRRSNDRRVKEVPVKVEKRNSNNRRTFADRRNKTI